jgi:hypothetical protein
MGLFHQCEWEIAAKTYAPPTSVNGPCEMSEDMASKLVFGVTTLLLKCRHCGATKEREMLGAEIKPPADVQKVE